MKSPALNSALKPAHKDLCLGAPSRNFSRSEPTARGLAGPRGVGHHRVASVGAIGAAGTFGLVSTLLLCPGSSSRRQYRQASAPCPHASAPPPPDCSQPWLRVLASRAVSVNSPSAVQVSANPGDQNGPSSQHRPADRSVEEVVVPPHGACIRALHIKDFALVEDEMVVFNPGLNVVTGESGAGKSVLIEALSQLCGASAPSECVRQPADTAIIQGTYLLGSLAATAARRVLKECGLPQRALPIVAKEGEEGKQQLLLIRREIVQQAGGTCRSKCYINGASTSLRVLRELAALLVDANGQHSSVMLKDPSTQLELLDRIAGTRALAASFAVSLSKAEELEHRLAELEEMEDEEERERLQKICDTVSKAGIKAGEELCLRQSLKRMEGRRAAVEQCSLARTAISGDQGGLVGAVRSVEVQLGAVLRQEQQMEAAEAAARLEANRQAGKEADKDVEEAEEEEEEWERRDASEDEDSASSHLGSSSMEDALDALTLAREQLAHAEAAVKAYSRSVQWDQREHEAKSTRLKMIEQLLKQHRCRSTGELVQLVEQYSTKLEQYYEAEGCQEEWAQYLQKLHTTLRVDAVALSLRRRAAATQLKASVESCLGELAMGGSRFEVSISWRPSYVELSEDEDWGVIAEDGIWLSDKDIEVNAAVQGMEEEGEKEEEEEQQLQLNSNDVPVAVELAQAEDTTRAEALSANLNADSATDSSAPADASEVTPAPLSCSTSQESNLDFDASSSNHEHARPSAELEGVDDRQHRGLKGARFLIGHSGLDRVEFLLAAGPSEPLRPLSAVASGGESARIMLALKAAPCSMSTPLEQEQVYKHGDSTETGSLLPALILDEIDSGIGARLGASVGQILRRMSAQGSDPSSWSDSSEGSQCAAQSLPAQTNASQVICVTHLPQVACYAANHIKVKKISGEQGRVITKFQTLRSWDARAEEVAAMLGLEKEVAEEMLRTAQRGGLSENSHKQSSTSRSPR